jgi:D-sedoheptulose 7-phosphate isomerase
MSDTDKKLADLYPFLHGKAKEPASENKSLLESIRQKVAQSVSQKEQFFAETGQALTTSLAGSWKHSVALEMD